MAFERKHLKPFAGSATNNGQFGSAQVGTKVLSNDPDVIQDLAAWEQGWSAATISGQRLPTLEEMQALFYVMGYHLGYMYQSGIPEYNAETEYQTRSVVRLAGSYRLYGSLVDNNIGNPVTDTDFWEVIVDLENVPQDQASEAEGGIGTNNTKWVSPLVANAAIKANAIGGSNYEWVDITSSVTLGVENTNTSDYPVEIMAYSVWSQGGARFINITTPDFTREVAAGGGSANFRAYTTLIVPPMGTYTVTRTPADATSLTIWRRQLV